jgi:hypothetical protein
MPAVDSRLVLKRGATFAFSAIRRDSVTLARLSLVGVTVKCQVRVIDNGVEKLLGTAVIVITNAAQAEYGVTIANTITAKWPLGEVFADISYTEAGVVRKTETFSVWIEWSPTQ